MRVAVADNSNLFRRGLVRLLSSAGVETVLQTQTGDELVDGLRALGEGTPEAAIVDLRMPPGHDDEGVRTATVIKNVWPAMGVLVLSAHAEPHYAARLLSLDQPGVGYLLKDNVDDTTELVAALHRVACGDLAVDPTLVRDLLLRRPADDPVAALAPRRREALTLMAQGLSNRGIADRLGVTLRTAENHVSAVFDALGLDEAGENRRVRAVLAFLRSTERGGSR